jgi:hypothetical protein
VLDVDGITGGFNFQNAWTGSWLASGHWAKPRRIRVRLTVIHGESIELLKAFLLMDYRCFSDRFFKAFTYRPLFP